MSRQQKALWLKEAKGKLVVGPKAIDKPGHGELLVRIEATALNPVDWKVHQYAFAFEHYPVVLGSDSAGVVEEIGEGVTGWKKGDRVVHEGFWIGNEIATFQQYTTISADLAAKIPSNISTDEAASIPLAIVTAAIGMYSGGDADLGITETLIAEGKGKSDGNPFSIPASLPSAGGLTLLLAKIYNDGDPGLGLTAPWTVEGKGKYAGKPFVISAASTSVGQLVLQLAKLSGFSPIITTSSPSNFELLKSLGATHTLSRNAIDSLGAEVAKITSEPVLYAYDAWSSPDSQQAIYDMLAPNGSFATVLAKAVKEVDGKNIAVHQVFGSVHKPEHRKLGVSLFAALEGLLANGTIKPNPVEILPNGLEGIVDGLARMAADKVSGKKLIAKPQETV